MSSKFFSQAWANAGDKTAIPNTVQPGGEVSYPEGYGSDYQLDQLTNPAAKDVERQIDNQLRFDITELLKELQENGMLPYSAIYDYPVGAYTKGTDNLQYRALIINGPSTTAVDPVGDATGTWIGADMTSVYPATVGAANVFTAASLPTTFVVNQEFHISFDAENTGACTLNGISIKNRLGENPLANEIGPLKFLELIFDGTNFILRDSLLHTLVFLGALQSIPTATSTQITGFTESFDNANAFSAGSPNQITVPSSGISHAKIKAKVDFDDNVTGARQILIEKDSAINYTGFSRFQTQAATGTRETVLMAETPWIPVLGGEVFTFNVLQDSGGNLNVLGDGAGSFTWLYAEFK